MKPALKQTVLALGILLLFTIIRPFSSHADCPPLPNDACDALNKLFQQQPDGPWYSQTPTQFANKVLETSNPNEIFGERYTYAQIDWIINSIAAMLNPAININSADKLLQFFTLIQKIIGDLQNGKQPTFADYAKLGPTGVFAGGISLLYNNPPASGIKEIQGLAERVFDLGTGAQPVYAQGFGYGGLSSGGNGVVFLWRATRNMAYLISVVLLIAAGFAIMFRVKINPQTVVTIQTMIPKLIITLILITFSFAIAGLAIDLIYVIIAGFVGFMSLGGVMDRPGEIGNVINWLTNSSFWAYIWLQASTWIFALIISVVITIVITSILSGLGAVLGTIAAIVIFIWLNITMVRIFIMLVKAYVMLILQICIAPLQIMLDLIPGQQGFGPWFRNLISNASVFVVVPVMLFIQYTLSWSIVANNALHIKDFSSAFSGGGTNLKLPYVELAGSALGSWNFLTPILIGLFIFSLTPKVAEMIRDMLKIPAFKYGSALGETFKPLSYPFNLAKTAAEKGVTDAGGKTLSSSIADIRQRRSEGTPSRTVREAAGEAPLE